MNIGKYKTFAVISFGKKSLQAALFRRLKTKYELIRHFSAVPDPADPVKSWKDLFRDLAISKDDPLILCGALKEGFFFRTRLPELPVKSIRGALSLELPRRMFAARDGERVIAFSVFPVSEEEDGSGNGTEKKLTVNAYTLPAESLEELSSILLQCGRKADAYIYPFLAHQESDPPLYLADVEENYYFEADNWQVANTEKNDPAGSNMEWKKIFKGLFKLPDDFPVEDFFSLLLCARFALLPAFPASEAGLDILPAKLRPSRLKSQIKLGSFLLLLLCANILWSCSGEWIRNAREYKQLVREKAVLQEQNRKYKSAIRKAEKAGRERQKITAINPGEDQVVKKLYDLTTFLPSGVMISSMRWSDSGLDLTMFSEENSAISEIFRTKFPYWKLANIQQRNFGSAATMITVKLSNIDGNGNMEEGRRK